MGAIPNNPPVIENIAGGLLGLVKPLEVNLIRIGNGESPPAIRPPAMRPPTMMGSLLIDNVKSPMRMPIEQHGAAAVDGLLLPP